MTKVFKEKINKLFKIKIRLNQVFRPTKESKTLRRLSSSARESWLITITRNGNYIEYNILNLIYSASELNLLTNFKNVNQCDF